MSAQNNVNQRLLAQIAQEEREYQEQLNRANRVQFGATMGNMPEPGAVRIDHVSSNRYQDMQQFMQAYAKTYPKTTPLEKLFLQGFPSVYDAIEKHIDKLSGGKFTVALDQDLINVIHQFVESSNSTMQGGSVLPVNQETVNQLLVRFMYDRKTEYEAMLVAQKRAAQERMYYMPSMPQMRDSDRGIEANHKFFKDQPFSVQQREDFLKQMGVGVNRTKRTPW